MKELGNSYKGMDMGIAHVVRHVHVHTMFYQVFPQSSNGHRAGVPFEKSSSSSSSRYSRVLPGVALGVAESVSCDVVVIC